VVNLASSAGAAIIASRRLISREPIFSLAPLLELSGQLVLKPRPETKAIPQGQKTTMTLLTETPVSDLYTLEVVTSRLAEPRTMTARHGASSGETQH
jgi:hypothetical protein